VNVGKTLFAQIMEFVPWNSFTRIVQRYRGNAGVRTLSCTEQFRALAFAQLTSAAGSLQGPGLGQDARFPEQHHLLACIDHCRAV
jgi:hypothetical protein